jgi:hypothetical protein
MDVPDGNPGVIRRGQLRERTERREKKDSQGF